MNLLFSIHFIKQNHFSDTSKNLRSANFRAPQTASVFYSNFTKPDLGSKNLHFLNYSNVPTIASPPVLKLLDNQGYLWLPHDLTKVIKLIGETLGQKNFLMKCVLPNIILLLNKMSHILPNKMLEILKLQKLPIPEGREKWPPEVAINASLYKFGGTGP